MFVDSNIIALVHRCISSSLFIQSRVSFQPCVYSAVCINFWSVGGSSVFIVKSYTLVYLQVLLMFCCAPSCTMLVCRCSAGFVSTFLLYVGMISYSVLCFWIFILWIWIFISWVALCASFAVAWVWYAARWPKLIQAWTLTSPLDIWSFQRKTEQPHYLYVLQ